MLPPFFSYSASTRNTIIFVFSAVDVSPTPTRRLRTNSHHVLCLACSSVTRTTPRAIGALIPRLAAFSPHVTSCSMNTSFPSASPHRPRLHPLPHPRFWSNKFPCQCRAAPSRLPRPSRQVIIMLTSLPVLLSRMPCLHQLQHHPSTTHQLPLPQLTRLLHSPPHRHPLPLPLQATL